MTKQVEFFFDFGSPASYVAWTQLPMLLNRTGADAIYRPMLLGGVFKETGNTSPMTVKAKGAYVAVDLARCAKMLGVPLVYNSAFPVNTIAVMRGAIAAQEDGYFDEYAPAVWQGMWMDDKNMADPETIGSVLTAAGIDQEKFAARIGEDSIKAKLRENTDEAVSRGVFGAPTFFVGDEMFWGQDRLDHVERALR